MMSSAAIDVLMKNYAHGNLSCARRIDDQKIASVSVGGSASQAARKVVSTLTPKVHV